MKAFQFLQNININYRNGSPTDSADLLFNGNTITIQDEKLYWHVPSGGLLIIHDFQQNSFDEGLKQLEKLPNCTNKVTREQIKELEAIGRKLWKKGYDESEIEEYCDIEGYIQNAEYTQEGYYIWLGWSDAREDFTELDKYYSQA